MNTSTKRLSNGRISVEIAALGAELQTLTTADGKSWLWNGDAAFWTGRSPILFPIVGKAPDNRIRIDGTPYDMAQHGFARRSQFTLATSTDTLCRYELAASEATRAVYPFEFLLSVEYALDDNRLTVSAEVENRDTRIMPFGFGFHPAFLWPLPGAEGKPHRVVLDNGAEPELVRLQEGLVDEGRLPSPFTQGELTLDHGMFDADAMIFPEGAGNGLVYGAEEGPALNFSFDNLPNIALWSKPGTDPAPPFLCIEPWHGTAADVGSSGELSERPYSTLLPPGQTSRFAWSVELPA
ncbi:aldose 1-epimerase family protein [Neorhizobium lilium]|uniref:Aldose 1-epimerase family protein n=1 Tax=Neorhizobium lilium TaxID=2503024 RepID=A0A3S3VGJ1_9HYPH|nr:aldose 1-epimerase family protein [Neorhizobium lilium]RWX76059.1 aldose 1-epimerase family protein [Neorhizobium lilium]